MNKYENFLLSYKEKHNNLMVLTVENRSAIRDISNILGNSFIDVGIAEQSMVGISAGLALCNKLPIIHGLASFLTMRSFEFIRTDIGYPNLTIKLVGTFSGFLSEGNGPTHQAIEDIALMRNIPNMNIFCPADEDDLILGLEDVFNSPNPFYIRYNDLKAIEKHKKFEMGKSETFSEGNDVSILVYGVLFNQAIKALSKLKKKGIKARVINLRTLKPIDKKKILKILDNSDLIVTLEDHFKVGGLFSIMAEIMAGGKIYNKILPISLDERWFKPSLFNDVLEHEGYTAEQISKKIYKYLTKGKNVK
ncbi:MAG: hypothetical protein JXA68_07245 [Ignavibacteriales bacterium]|nr:hypothetical protein [Ignavibacteriales bacterium]